MTTLEELKKNLRNTQARLRYSHKKADKIAGTPRYEIKEFFGTMEAREAAWEAEFEKQSEIEDEIVELKTEIFNVELEQKLEKIAHPRKTALFPL